MSLTFCRPRAAVFLAACVSTFGLVACGPSNSPSQAPARPGGTPPRIAVSTVQAQQRDVPVLINATGTVAPLSSVEVRPQVTSVIEQVHVREGQVVRAGEPLFTLDGRVDQANLAKAQAQLARDQASQADLQRQLNRNRELLAQNFVSQGAVDTVQAQLEAQQAALAADNAAIDAARVALSYTQIRAPGAGRIGAINLYPGSSVQANATTLVTITQIDPIAVAFNLPQRHLGDALAGLPGGGATVQALLPDSRTTLTGRLQFVDNNVDATSGSVRVKALFANPQRQLWPGAFVNVSLTLRTLKDSVVVPQAAIIQSARGTIVYTVHDGKAQLRPVQVLYASGADAAVSGVRAGEAVVVDGRQNLRPDVPVVERNAGAASAP